MTITSIRVAGVVFAAFLLATSQVLDAAASGALRPAAGAPDPKSMVLTSADLGGANVTAQGYYKDKDFSSVISYSREFEDGRLGSTLLPYVDSEAEVGTSAATTRNFLLSYRALLGTKQGRRMIVESIADEAGEDGFLSNIQVGRPRNLGVGPGSFVVPISARILGARTEFPMAAFRVERVLGIVSAMGIPGRRLPLTTMTRLAKIMAVRMTAELMPKSTAAPTISGSPAVGQTLMASTGTWSGKPTIFTYQWQRCDVAASACAPIASATSATYVVTDADVGSTLRVAVTARNVVGSATASSAPTDVIPASGAPVEAALPRLAGVAQIGRMVGCHLSGGTGSGCDSRL